MEWRLGLRQRRRPIRMFWYRPREAPGTTNFGDELGPLIVAHLSGREVVRVPIEETDLLAVGSILEMAARSERSDPFLVWGAGFIRNGGDRLVDRFDCAAVRGRRTAERLHADSVPLGDPALCLNLYAERTLVRHRLGIVPHYVDVGDPIVTEAAKREGTVLIDPRRSPGDVVDVIASCEAIASSSLHGCIVADALGVPNAWVRISDKVSGGGYKFFDYFSAHGLDDVEPVTATAPDDLTSARLEPVLQAWERPLTRQLAEALVAAFPFGP